MGKKRKTTADAGMESEASLPASTSNAGLPVVAGGNAIDPSLAALFTQSSGPVLAPQFTAQKQSASRREGKEAGNTEDKDSTISVGLGDSDDDEQMLNGGDGERMAAGATEDSTSEEEVADKVPSKRKRKREDRNDDLEESYMRRVAREEARERKKHKKDAKGKEKLNGESFEQRKTDEAEQGASEEPEADSEASSSPGSQAQSDQSSDEEADTEEINNNTAPPPPLHETVVAATNLDEPSALEESSRTVFLGNVSTDAIKSKSAKKTLLSHLSSFFPSLSSAGGIGTTPKIESIRFRSTAFSTTAVPKRGAYARRDLMDSTTRGTNAYVVYSTAAAARKALSLNGSVVLDRHLRVDSVAHPAKVDHRRCVFVGNLSFVDEETSTDEGPDDQAGNKKKQKKKQRQPADAEEGLWRTFNAHTKLTTLDKSTTTPGAVESVRVIRDRSTRVGKGFAYVQFHDENAVEAALLLDGKKFPPLLPRALRVARAKRSSTAASAPKRDTPANSGRAGRVGRKTSGGAGAPGSHEQASLAGRAARMLGQAGAAKLRKKARSEGHSATGANAIAPVARGASANSGNSRIIFEGHRASEMKGPGGGTAGGIKVKTKSRGVKARSRGGSEGGGGGGGGGKPKTRSARRAKAWKSEKKGGK